VTVALEPSVPSGVLEKDGRYAGAKRGLARSPTEEKSDTGKEIKAA
jgi:hypothetical protein